MDLADRILPAFDTPSGLPLSMVNLGLRVGVSDTDNRGLVSTAEASTLQLEFKYLSLLTDEEEYWRKAEKVMQVIKGSHLNTGLASIFMKYVCYVCRMGLMMLILLLARRTDGSSFLPSDLALVGILTTNIYCTFTTSCMTRSHTLTSRSENSTSKLYASSSSSSASTRY